MMDLRLSAGGVAFLNPTIEDALNFGQGPIDRDPPARIRAT